MSSISFPRMREAANTALKELSKPAIHPFPAFSTGPEPSERCHIVGCGETLYGS